MNAVKGITHPFQLEHARPRAICSSDYGMVWKAGSTLAMALASLAGLGLGLIAVSPKQGSLLLYRWRRVVY